MIMLYFERGSVAGTVRGRRNPVWVHTPEGMRVAVAAWLTAKH
jgi:hypothetical protein